MSQTRTTPLDGDADEGNTVGSLMQAETIIAACWGVTGMGCAGCGQAAVAIDQVVAIGEVRDLPRRFAALLDHSDAELARRVEGQVWSALESVGHTADVLGAVKSLLDQFTADDNRPWRPGSVKVEVAAPGSNGRETMAILAALSAHAAGLVGTISGMTEEDWRNPSASDGTSRAEQVWVAVHSARHHLEDAELALGVARPDGHAPSP